MEKSFKDKLVDILKTNSRFIDQDGELIKAAIIDGAWKIDREIVKLLISDSRIKEKFFDEIDGHWIFNINTFIDYISDKDFLDNSYTRFRNKIGLNIDGKYFKERGEVCLVWPYKDCILEGGQTKEEEKRKEIFFNEILAQDEIDRLLDPKILTNWKRYTTDGEQDVSAIGRNEAGTIKENLILKGNNLLALHCLKQNFTNKIKLIYIDPPYNTGNDEFGYNDNFNHSSWLTFTKNRLEIARTLLKRDGVIFINIGDEEVHYLKVLCDEIFGRDNFISTIARVSKTASNLGTHFAPSIDFLLSYAKNMTNVPPFKDKVDESLYKKIEIDGPRKGEKYRDDVAFYQASQKDLRPNQKFFVKCPDSSMVIPPCSIQDEIMRLGDGRWRWTKDTYTANKSLLVFKRTTKSPLVDKEGKQAEWNVYTKSYLLDRQEEGTKPRNYLDEFINRKGADYIKKLDIDFNYSKPVELIEYLINITDTNSDDIILDFFAGSGTTAEAVVRANSKDKANRTFILCEQLDYVENATIKRVRKILGEYSFISVELKKANQIWIDKINLASNDLSTVFKSICEDSFLKWYINPEEPENALSDFMEIGKSDNGLEKQKKLLCELLNKNQLYVNLSEMEDTKFSISEHDKELNKQFYGDACNA